ncbi:MAG: rhodanese-like domain-containing protein [Spirochaetales bacterium]|nr:rhodanese-like domain-containing protein [Spirochaetales bacterium]
MKISVKALVLLLALTALFGFIACSGKEEAAPAAAPAEAPAVEVNYVEEAALAYFAELPADNNMIAQDAFIEKIKAGEDLFVLDIRQPDVYAESHVKGAVNVPWGPALADALDVLPMDETIYVYCYTGQTAGQAVAALKVAGFDTKSIRFGWNLGISKVEGYEAATEKTLNALPEPAGNYFDAGVKEAVAAYFKGLAEIADPVWKNYKISEADAKKLIDEGSSDIYVLSIRSAAHYAEGHVPTAANIPWGKGMQEYFETLPTDKKIIVYCYTGQTAGQTTAVLRLLGYDAYSMNGGMGTPANAPSGWINKGYEVVK